MSLLPANPTARRREERLLVQARLKQLEAGIDRALEMAKEGGAKAPPTFTDSDVEEVGKLLVEGRIKLPPHVRITVITTIETVRSKIFGTAELFHHEADQVCTKLLRPMTVLGALEAGLIRRIASGWMWSEVAYERLAASGAHNG
jgi:hypothetical protein